MWLTGLGCWCLCGPVELSWLWWQQLEQQALGADDIEYNGAWHIIATMPLSCAGGCSLATQDTLQLRSSAPTEAFLSCYLPPCARVTMAREWSAANVWFSTPNVNELLRLVFELEKTGRKARCTYKCVHSIWWHFPNSHHNDIRQIKAQDDSRLLHSGNYSDFVWKFLFNCV